MKTADLIATLAQNLRPIQRGAARRDLYLALFVGGCAAGVLLLAWLGLRPMAEALQSGSFWMKAAFTVVIAAAGLQLSDRLARPGGTAGSSAAVIGAALAAMTLLGLAQLVSTPAHQRLALWLGQTWNLCPFRILALASPIFIAAVWAMRRMAPATPAAGGAAAGLVSGAIGATLYGLHCPETAAAFVATWYTLGIAACAVLGALVGSRLLRW